MMTKNVCVAPGARVGTTSHSSSPLGSAWHTWSMPGGPATTPSASNVSTNDTSRAVDGPSFVMSIRATTGTPDGTWAIGWRLRSTNCLVTLRSATIVTSEPMVATLFDNVGSSVVV